MSETKEKRNYAIFVVYAVSFYTSSIFCGYLLVTESVLIIR
jgi:hypothetical protein